MVDSTFFYKLFYHVTLLILLLDGVRTMDLSSGPRQFMIDTLESGQCIGETLTQRSRRFTHM